MQGVFVRAIALSLSARPAAAKINTGAFVAFSGAHQVSGKTPVFRPELLEKTCRRGLSEVCWFIIHHITFKRDKRNHMYSPYSCCLFKTHLIYLYITIRWCPHSYVCQILNHSNHCKISTMIPTLTVCMSYQVFQATKADESGHIQLLVWFVDVWGAELMVTVGFAVDIWCMIYEIWYMKYEIWYMKYDIISIYSII